MFLTAAEGIVSHRLPVSVWSIVSGEIILLPAELIALPEGANRSRPIIQASARRFLYFLFPGNDQVIVRRVVLAVARSKFRQRQYCLAQFTDMLFYYCYKCFFNILINHYIVCE